jgi:hypothetical protein
MAITKASKTIIAAGTSCAAGGTKASPSVTGTSWDCTTYYGGELNYRITNGSSAPTAACVITFQVSPDNSVWFDYYSITGDTTANSTYSGSIILDRAVMYVRAIAYGNATNAVTVESVLQAVTGV